MDLLTDDQLVTAVQGVKTGVEQMATEVSKTKDAGRATELLDTMDNLLGRFGNISAISPEEFTNVAKGTNYFQCLKQFLLKS